MDTPARANRWRETSCKLSIFNCTQCINNSQGINGITANYSKPTLKTTMNFSQINWLAVIVAAVSALLVGGIWYSKALAIECS
jgi:hypothetical protein